MDMRKCGLPELLLIVRYNINSSLTTSCWSPIRVWYYTSIIAFMSFKILELKKKRGRPRKKQTDKTSQVKQICEECGKTFKNLKAHLESHKPQDKDVSFKCTVCDKIFRKKRSREIHFKRKHLGIRQQCPICNKSKCISTDL